MITYKRTVLIILLCLMLLFTGLQLYLILQPLLVVDPETKYAHLVNKYQILRMQRLALEEQYALASTKRELAKLIAAGTGRSLALNKLSLPDNHFLSEPARANISLSLAQTKTFEQLEAYVSSSKPLKPGALTKDEKFILESSPEDFTLQLMGVRDPNELRRYAQDNQLENTRIIHTYYLNKDWYVLVSGSYKNHTEALKAIDSLPEEIKSQKPWIRQIASLQKAIQLYREGHP